VRKADNLPTSCAVVTKSGSLNFLEPSGHVHACIGTALPLPHRERIVLPSVKRIGSKLTEERIAVYCDRHTERMMKIPDRVLLP